MVSLKEKKEDKKHHLLSHSIGFSYPTNVLLSLFLHKVLF